MSGSPTTLGARRLVSMTSPPGTSGGPGVGVGVGPPLWKIWWTEFVNWDDDDIYSLYISGTMPNWWSNQTTTNQIKVPVLFQFWTPRFLPIKCQLICWFEIPIVSHTRSRQISQLIMPAARWCLWPNPKSALRVPVRVAAGLTGFDRIYVGMCNLYNLTRFGFVRGKPLHPADNKTIIMFPFNWPGLADIVHFQTHSDHCILHLWMYLRLCVPYNPKSSIFTPFTLPKHPNRGRNLARVRMHQISSFF